MKYHEQWWWRSLGVSELCFTLILMTLAVDCLLNIKSLALENVLSERIQFQDFFLSKKPYWHTQTHTHTLARARAHTHTHTHTHKGTHTGVQQLGEKSGLFFSSVPHRQRSRNRSTLLRLAHERDQRTHLQFGCLFWYKPHWFQTSFVHQMR